MNSTERGDLCFFSSVLYQIYQITKQQPMIFPVGETFKSFLFRFFFFCLCGPSNKYCTRRRRRNTPCLSRPSGERAAARGLCSSPPHVSRRSLLGGARVCGVSGKSTSEFFLSPFTGSHNLSVSAQSCSPSQCAPLVRHRRRRAQVFGVFFVVEFLLFILGGGWGGRTPQQFQLSLFSIVSNLRVSSSWISTARFVYVRERRGLLLLLLLPCRLLSSGRDVASAHTDARCQKRDVRWTLPWIQHEESRLLTSPPPRTAPHRTAPHRTAYPSTIAGAEDCGRAAAQVPFISSAPGDM